MKVPSLYSPLLSSPGDQFTGGYHPCTHLCCPHQGTSLHEGTILVLTSAVLTRRPVYRRIPSSYSPLLSSPGDQFTGGYHPCTHLCCPHQGTSLQEGTILVLTSAVLTRGPVYSKVPSLYSPLLSSPGDQFTGGYHPRTHLCCPHQGTSLQEATILVLTSAVLTRRPVYRRIPSLYSPLLSSQGDQFTGGYHPCTHLCCPHKGTSLQEATILVLTSAVLTRRPVYRCARVCARVCVSVS